MASAKKNVQNTAPAQETVHARKPRTVDPDERIALVEAKIAQVEGLIEERKVLLAKTEALAAQRKDALKKNEDALQALLDKKERIIALKERKANHAPSSARISKAAEKAELEALREALKASGKSVEEFLAELQK